MLAEGLREVLGGLAPSLPVHRQVLPAPECVSKDRKEHAADDKGRDRIEGPSEVLMVSWNQLEVHGQQAELRQIEARVEKVVRCEPDLGLFISTHIPAVG
jgi:hypothetical protein